MVGVRRVVRRRVRAVVGGCIVAGFGCVVVDWRVLCVGGCGIEWWWWWRFIEGGQRAFCTLSAKRGRSWDKEWEAAGGVMLSYLGHFCTLLTQGV